jgi:chemotaxis protein CheC
MDEILTPLRSLSQGDKDDIRAICSLGAAQAGSALSRLAGVEVVVAPPEVFTLPLGDVPALFGGLDAPAVGVLVPFQGDVEGNILLLFPDGGRNDLENLLFQDSSEASMELVDSAFTETGNILSGAFITVLSRLSGRLLINLPPITVKDMAGAILDTILAEIGSHTDEVLALVSRLKDQTGHSLVKAIIIPDPGSIELFLEASARLRSGP